MLWLLLAEALLLFRCAQGIAPGRIGECWKAFAVGIFLTALANAAMWAFRHGYLPYPWTNLIWYLWLPAFAEFARAPALQLEVIQEALGVTPASTGNRCAQSPSAA